VGSNIDFERVSNQKIHGKLWFGEAVRSLSSLLRLVILTSVVLLVLSTCRKNEPADSDDPSQTAPQQMVPQPRPASYELKINAAAQVLQPGVSEHFTIDIRDRTSGQQPQLRDLQTKALHVMVVRQDLDWFEHIHPVRQPGGDFSMTIVFPSDGAYVVYADFAPDEEPEEMQQQKLQVGSTVPRSTALQETPLTKKIGAYEVGLKMVPTNPEDDPGWTTLTFHLTRSGNPVHDLQPLDTLGHLLILREGAEDVVYAHSTDGEATGGVQAMAHLPALPTGVGEHEHRGDNLGPDVTFHARFGKPGLYKLWAEFHPGKDHVTADFVVAIR